MAIWLAATVLVLQLPSNALAETEIAASGVHSLSSPQTDLYTAFLTEASRRFALPEHWIRAVLQVESSGNVCAVSPRGALGLMQIMPQTWLELSARYDLGANPFDPRDNILAGTAYLREMLERFGPGGFLAAYNVGPKRYEEYLASGRPLPQETKTYVARLVRLIGIKQHEQATLAIRQTVRWRQAALFFDRSDGSWVNARSTSALDFMNSPKGFPNMDGLALVRGVSQLFVQRSTEAELR
ncbi:lytic transglycosylase domain-containing protein [Bradyrhizobium sp. CB82]|uniref:lytic transglycosylase domain-containing protein n=1 Tax=Bradyrhizobium sp. CB82 TaxID=3039159 RepID=UPI0024B1FC14|nr:lytic transglycosylase domain-containing protein [Bradyrhizobium sp. CB82]WFU40261.1 lytic transglycosylase domain-containing protein [Bradyrhizobium sp. CB82]